MEDFESEFVQKYGPVRVKWITPPPAHAVFTRPHALNYFHDGHLYRTKGERGSSTFELFFDLLYVGIVANLAKGATEEATGLSLLKYIILFMPTWHVWNDMRDFMNYYYNNDWTQKVYVLWIMTLQIVYTNNANSVLESRSQTALVVVTHILSRMTTATLMFAYTFPIREHRRQMRAHFVMYTVVACVWIPVIFVSTRAKIAISLVCIVLENIEWTLTYHPWFKQQIGAHEYSTALNIEHDVERLSAFYIIALGEFLYSISANSPAGIAFNLRLARAILVLVIGYALLWFYFNGDGSERAIHALRYSSWTAFAHLFCHTFLVCGLIVAADAAGEMVSIDFDSTKKWAHFPEESSAIEAFAFAETSGEERTVNKLYSLQFFLTGGICIGMMMIALLAFLDKTVDPPGRRMMSKPFRIGLRVPVAIVILCLAFAELQTTLLLGIIAVLLVVLNVYETWAMLPTAEAVRNPLRTCGPQGVLPEQVQDGVIDDDS